MQQEDRQTTHIPIHSASHGQDEVSSVSIQVKEKQSDTFVFAPWFTLVFVGVVFVGVGFLFYQNYMLSKSLVAVSEQLLDESISHAETSIELGEYKNKYTHTKSERDRLESELNEKITLVASIKEELAGMGVVLREMEKLSQTDPELLQKYSKVFFLNEHYLPTSLKQIEPEYVYRDKVLWIHGGVQSYLENMLKSASSSGVDLMVLSSYRSFEEQAGIKSSYLTTYGVGANKFSADQGYSEHQLGTAVDFTTKKTGSSLYDFGGEEAYQWLLDNAHVYGFVLSYYEDNEYYRFEPWHWRFVGKDLAIFLYESGKYFYDVDQRGIDWYLGSIFD